MIYVVTRSDHYYPCSGAEDWELVTRDYEGAKQRAIGLATENPRYQSVWILKINEDNLHVQQEEVEGSETSTDPVERTANRYVSVYPSVDENAPLPSPRIEGRSETS